MWVDTPTTILRSFTHHKAIFLCVIAYIAILCLEPPQMVSADSITSNSLLMNWAAPMLNELDGTLKNYSLSCSADEDVNASFIHVLDSNVNTYNVSGLKPATTYSCCIMASTTTGQSRRECREVSTLEDGIILYNNNQYAVIAFLIYHTL